MDDGRFTMMVKLVRSYLHIYMKCEMYLHTFVPR
jgi:hypothetical protein